MGPAAVKGESELGTPPPPKFFGRFVDNNAIRSCRPLISRGWSADYMRKFEDGGGGWSLLIFTRLVGMMEWLPPRGHIHPGTEFTSLV